MNRNPYRTTSFIDGIALLSLATIPFIGLYLAAGCVFVAWLAKDRLLHNLVARATSGYPPNKGPIKKGPTLLGRVLTLVDAVQVKYLRLRGKLPLAVEANIALRGLASRKAAEVPDESNWDPEWDAPQATDGIEFIPKGGSYRPTGNG